VLRRGKPRLYAEFDYAHGEFDYRHENLILGNVKLIVPDESLRLIAIDIDGTLLNPEFQISAYRSGGTSAGRWRGR